MQIRDSEHQPEASDLMWLGLGMNEYNVGRDHRFYQENMDLLGKRALLGYRDRPGTINNINMIHNVTRFWYEKTLPQLNCRVDWHAEILEHREKRAWPRAALRAQRTLIAQELGVERVNTLAVNASSGNASSGKLEKAAMGLAAAGFFTVCFMYKMLTM